MSAVHPTESMIMITADHYSTRRNITEDSFDWLHHVSPAADHHMDIPYLPLVPVSGPSGTHSHRLGHGQGTQAQPL